MDRFLLKVIIDYPTLEEEKLIIRENLKGSLPQVTPVTTAGEILSARGIVNEVYIDEKIEQYIADVVFATRYPDRYGLAELKDMISFGGSPAQVSRLPRRPVRTLSSSIADTLCQRM